MTPPASSSLTGAPPLGGEIRGETWPTTPPAGSPPAASPSKPPRSRRRRILRRVAQIGAVPLLALGGTGYWALDRYVIDHVQIEDVSAYEAQVRASTTAGGATASGVSATELDAAAEAVITATTYTSQAMTITIETVVKGTGNDKVTYYVADVVVNDGTALRGGFADNKYGANIVEDTSVIAEAYDAVFAVNGDYYGYRDSGIVIRNGVLYRDEGARTGLAIYADGHMEIYDETTTSGEELVAAGVWNTLSFGPALVEDGAILSGIEDVEVDTNFGNHSIQGDQPRTGIGMVDTNHFVFVVADGRAEGYSRGVTMTEFAQIFDDLGATVAYNLDGGGSSTMYFNGSLVNNPLGRGAERGTSDILYLA